MSRALAAAPLLMLAACGGGAATTTIRLHARGSMLAHWGDEVAGIEHNASTPGFT